MINIEEKSVWNKVPVVSLWQIICHINLVGENWSCQDLCCLLMDNISIFEIFVFFLSKEVWG